MLDSVEKFLSALDASLRNGTFTKLTLGNYKGTEFQLQRILGRRIATTQGDRLSLTYRYKTRDIVKNFNIAEAAETVGNFLNEGFYSGHLFTSEKDHQLEIKKNGRAILSTSSNMLKAVASAKHDRAKRSFLDPSAPYLKALGITDGNGRVLDRSRDKWRQINKYVEILTNLLDKSELTEARKLRIVDMGSGKGYLTFAAYDYLTNVRKVRAEVSGIEQRKELVDHCNQIVLDNGFATLRFVHGSISSYELGEVDVLIALHACDTATDDAIYKGITAGAELIITAPCCHQELRPQIKPPAILKDVLKHGILLEHDAEILTDGLRAMLLEANGYDARVFEFVGVEHTPKNSMIVGTRSKGRAGKERAENSIQDLMEFYGIRCQRLYHLLYGAAAGAP